MSDKPIICSGPEVRALIDGRKTQRREPLLNQKVWDRVGDGILRMYPRQECGVPYAIGDRIWVREKWARHQASESKIHERGDGHRWGSPIYRATFGAMLAPVSEGFTRWRSPVCMPRWASRLTITITGVRVRRVQDIGEGDAKAEGAKAILVPPDGGSHPHIEGYIDLWNSSINAKRGYGWHTDPRVVALTFDVKKGTIDADRIRV